MSYVVNQHMQCEPLKLIYCDIVLNKYFINWLNVMLWIDKIDRGIFERIKYDNTTIKHSIRINYHISSVQLLCKSTSRAVQFAWTNQYYQVQSKFSWRVWADFRGRFNVYFDRIKHLLHIASNNIAQRMRYLLTSSQISLKQHMKYHCTSQQISFV